MPKSNDLSKYKPYVYKRAEALGIPVVDAKKALYVGVTTKDVISAKRKNSEHCALARAALRLPDVNGAYVFRSMAFIEYPNRMERFQLPSSVQKEIVSFDRAQIFADGVYQLTPPAPSSRLEPMRKRSRAKHAAESRARKAAASRWTTTATRTGCSAGSSSRARTRGRRCRCGRSRPARSARAMRRARRGPVAPASQRTDDRRSS